ncbi:hypothetical protein [Methylibium rhizosphaerae]|uniref:hypothetical protein n=1 Tax=Methylibium rhizosphaerae TaxID=2570323 RepID=UPI001C611F3E|nr:hypothetical protein [Methylibium rhizosphaerae]
MRATPKSWNHLPAPADRADLAFQALFTDAEAEQLFLGLVPEQMEDKWFVYYEDGWLRFHRSWTGAFIYALRLDGSPAGVRVVESWVNRDPSQYKATDTEYDRKLVRFIIDAFLLRKPNVAFPMPSGPASAPGVVQHSYVGRGYPESPSNSSGKAGDA